MLTGHCYRIWADNFPTLYCCYMTEVINPNPNTSTGDWNRSGYQAAVLAAIVKEVYTIEIIRSLEMQQQKMKNQDTKINVKSANGFLDGKNMGLMML